MNHCLCLTHDTTYHGLYSNVATLCPSVVRREIDCLFLYIGGQLQSLHMDTNFPRIWMGSLDLDGYFFNSLIIDMKESH